MSLYGGAIWAIPNYRDKLRGVAVKSLSWLALLICSVSSFGQVLYVGMNADMRGGAAIGGESIRRGAMMAIEDINASGSINPYKLALKVSDHRGNPARGEDNVQDYGADPNVIAILGGIHTPVVMHELPLIHELKIPYLVPWAAGTPVIKNGYSPNFVFRLSVRDEYAGPVLIDHAKSSGIESVALFLERTGWGRSNDRSMNAAAKKLGVNVTSTTWFNWGEKKMDQAVKDAIDKGAKALMLVANSPEGIEVTQAMARQPEASRIPIISHWGITGGNFAEDVGKKTLSAVDLRVLQTYMFEDQAQRPQVQKLLKKYRKKFPDSPDVMEAIPGFVHGYDLIQLLALAIDQVDQVNRLNVRDALEKLPAYQGIVRNYQPAFTNRDHEALDSSDYSIARFNSKGELVPWD